MDRLRDLLRLKGLLGVSLEELKELIEAQDARRAAYRQDEDPARRLAIIARRSTPWPASSTSSGPAGPSSRTSKSELQAKRRRLQGRRRDLEAAAGS